MRTIVMTSIVLVCLVVPLPLLSTVNLPYFEIYQSEQNVCIVAANVYPHTHYKIERLDQQGIQTMSKEIIFDGKFGELNSYPGVDGLYAITDPCMPSGFYFYQIKREETSGWILDFYEEIEMEPFQENCNKNDVDGDFCLSGINPDDYDLPPTENDDDDSEEKGCGC